MSHRKISNTPENDIGKEEINNIQIEDYNNKESEEQSFENFLNSSQHSSPKEDTCISIDEENNAFSDDSELGENFSFSDDHQLHNRKNYFTYSENFNENQNNSHINNVTINNTHYQEVENHSDTFNNNNDNNDNNTMLFFNENQNGNEINETQEEEKETRQENEQYELREQETEEEEEEETKTTELFKKLLSHIEGTSTKQRCGLALLPEFTTAVSLFGMRPRLSSNYEYEEQMLSSTSDYSISTENHHKTKRKRRFCFYMIYNYLWPYLLLVTASIYDVLCIILLDSLNYEFLGNIISLLLIYMSFFYTRWFLRGPILGIRLAPHFRSPPRRRRLRKTSKILLFIVLILVIIGIASNGLILFARWRSSISSSKPISLTRIRMPRSTAIQIMLFLIMLISDLLSYIIISLNFQTFWLSLESVHLDIIEFKTKLESNEFENTQQAIISHTRVQGSLEMITRTWEPFVAISMAVYIVGILSRLYGALVSEQSFFWGYMSGFVYLTLLLLGMLVPCAIVTSSAKSITSRVSEISVHADPAKQSEYDSFLLYLLTASRGFKVLGVEVTLDAVSKVCLALFSMSTLVVSTSLHQTTKS